VAELFRGRPDINLPELVRDLVNAESVPFLSVLRYTESGLRKRVQWKRAWELQRKEDEIEAEVEAQRPALEAVEREKIQRVLAKERPRQQRESQEAYAQRMAEWAKFEAQEIGKRTHAAVSREKHERKGQEIGEIPVPPKYRTADFQRPSYWRLRGALDVPKERFVSYPGAEREADGSPVVTWAGFDHLQQALALATYYLERKDREGWGEQRLKPLLAGLVELLPWLLQWHNAYDPMHGMGMGDYFRSFVEDEARALGTTPEDLAGWRPSGDASGNRRRRRREAAE
jgi:hypothetical protein